MNKLFTMLIAAIFATVSYSAIAATPSSGGAMKMESKKTVKVAKKSKKSKKAAPKK